MKELDLLELEEMANDGNVEACQELARRYREGDGVSVDLTLAQRYLEYAEQFGGVQEEELPVEPVQQENSQPENKVEIQRKAPGEPKSDLPKIKEEMSRKSVVQLHSLSKEGNVFAQYQLACRVFADPKNVEEGFQQILQCEKAVKEALKEKKDSALNDLFVEIEDLIGQCYETGKGTNVSYSLAFEHYSNAFEFDSTHSLIVERCYREGIGCEKNEEKAQQLLEKRLQRGGFAEKYAYAMQFVNTNTIKAALWLQNALLTEDAKENGALASIARYELAKMGESDETGNPIHLGTEKQQIIQWSHKGSATAILYAYEQEFISGKAAFSDENRNQIWENSKDDYEKMRANLQLVIANGNAEEAARARKYLSNIESRKAIRERILTQAEELCRDDVSNSLLSKDEMALVQNALEPRLRWCIQKHSNGNVQKEKQYLAVLEKRIRMTENAEFKQRMLANYNESKRQEPYHMETMKADREQLQKYLAPKKHENKEWAKTCLSILEERMEVTEIAEFKRLTRNNMVDILSLRYRFATKDVIQKYRQCIRSIQAFYENHGLADDDWKRETIQELEGRIEALKAKAFRDDVDRKVTLGTQNDVEKGRDEYYSKLRQDIETYMKNGDDTDKKWGKEKLEILDRRDQNTIVAEKKRRENAVKDAKKRRGKEIDQMVEKLPWSLQLLYNCLWCIRKPLVILIFIEIVIQVFARTVTWNVYLGIPATIGAAFLLRKLYRKIMDIL